MYMCECVQIQVHFDTLSNMWVPTVSLPKFSLIKKFLLLEYNKSQSFCMHIESFFFLHTSVAFFSFLYYRHLVVNVHCWSVNTCSIKLDLCFIIVRFVIFTRSVNGVWNQQFSPSPHHWLKSTINITQGFIGLLEHIL